MLLVIGNSWNQVQVSWQSETQSPKSPFLYLVQEFFRIGNQTREQPWFTLRAFPLS